MLRRLASCQCQLAASAAGATSLQSSTRRLASLYNNHQHLFSSSPRWSDESLAAVRDKYEQKYKDRLEQKAAEQGLQNVEELKARKLHEARLRNRVMDQLARPQKASSASGTPSASVQDTPETQADAQSTKPRSAPPSSTGSSSKSPIKQLADIVDLPKLLPQSPEAIGEIWNGYHRMQDHTLSAAIPYEIYQKMSELGKKYKQFVVPLPREVVDEQGDKKMGAEMHFLQWAFLPHEGKGEGASADVPPPSTVLYTPLALFKSQSTFAQPHLILTHYTDLAASHGLVLMKGDLTPDCATKLPDAQLLVLRLQQFYQDAKPARADLLRTFHEKPEVFDVEALVKSVGEI